MRSTTAAAFALLLAGTAVAEPPVKLDPQLNPITRRTLRMSFKPPESGPIKIAFFDADSTLRVSLSGNLSANGPRDVALLPMVTDKIKELNDQGYLVAIVSNQAGIPRHVSLKDSSDAIQYTAHLLSERGAAIDYYDFAENRDGFRKPETGMGNLCAQIVKISTGRDIDWANTIMVGDSAYTKEDQAAHGNPGIDPSNADRGFGENLKKEHGGVRFIYASVFFGWKDHDVRRFDKLDEVKAFLQKYPDLR